MTDNNIKFVPVAPKTYEVRYVENKELSAFSKIASCLGLTRTECCSTCGVSNKPFKLEMNLRNAVGGHLYGSANNTNEALNESSAILRGTGNWEGGGTEGCFRRANREDLVSKINTAISEHIEGEGKAIIKTVHNTPS